MRSVILLLLGVHLVSAKIHSLQYIYTATSEIRSFPEVVIVGMVDDGQIVYYDSITQKAVPKQDWVNKAADPQYWERNTGNFLGFEQISKVNLNTLKQRFNQTGGVHTVQKMYGCEWDDQTGEKDAFKQYGYDGEDLFSRDFKENRWISPVQQGFPTVDKWNKDRALIESENNYYGTECIKWLKKYLDYGKSSLKKTVSPQVSLLQKDPSSPVTCHATGFYPSGVTITWMKNGQDHHEDVDLGELLPNADGTFQRTSTLTPDEWKYNVFRCVVEHQGKTFQSILTEDKIRTNYAPVPIGIIVAVVAAIILLILIGVAGYIVYKKKQGFKPVSGSDDGSNSSAQAVPQA